MSAENTAAEQLRERFNWQRVVAPRPWRPDVGEELIGYYGGRTLRKGQFGQYEVVVAHVPTQGAFAITGTHLIQLIDAALIQKGHPIRVKYLGKTRTKAEDEDGRSHEMKIFDLLIAEGLPIVEEGDLPEVRFP